MTSTTKWASISCHITKCSMNKSDRNRFIYNFIVNHCETEYPSVPWFHKFWYSMVNQVILFFLYLQHHVTSSPKSKVSCLHVEDVDVSARSRGSIAKSNREMSNMRQGWLQEASGRRPHTWLSLLLQGTQLWC